MAAKLPYVFILLTLPALAQVAQFENKQIVDIQFSPVQPLDPSDLARALPFQKGGILHADDVSAAIDNLFATGHFEDIAVDAELSGNGVTIRFVTQLTSFLGGLKVEGRMPNPAGHAGDPGRLVAWVGWRGVSVHGSSLSARSC